MAKKSRWQVVPTLLALIPCEGSLTGGRDPVPVFEAASEAAPQGADYDESHHLIAWWPGEGDFKDIAGTHDIDINEGVTTTDGGVVGQAFLFTGDAFGPKDAGQFLEIANPDVGPEADRLVLRPEVFTIDLWAQGLGDGQNAVESILIEKAIDNNSGNGPGLSYLIAWRGTGASRHIEADVAFSNAPITDLPARLVSEPVADGAWVHVALTVAADRTATLYVNGKAVDDFQVDPDPGPPVYGPGSIVIGNTWMWVRDSDAPGFGGTTFNGCIDEVRIFGRALSADEIKDIYGSGDDSTCPAEELKNTAPTVNEIECDVAECDVIDEGDIFVASVSFTDDDESDSWTASVDYGEGDVVDFAVIPPSFDLSHTYAQDGEYTITVTVTDGEGLEGCAPALEGCASASVVVNNVAPTVDAGAGATILEGDTVKSGGSFTDPGADTWTATIDYGDDPDAEPVVLTLGEDKSFEFSHVYADNNSDNTPYEITVTVTDDEGGLGSASATVVVNNVAPLVEEGPDDKVIVEGETYTSYVTFSDPGEDEWTALVDYGDGTIQTLEMIEKTFHLSHIYDTNEACSPFTVTVTVRDDDGAEDSGTAQVKVTVIHQISVYKANVKLERGRSRSGPRDRFDVAGRLPLSLLACFDPYYEAFTVNFGSFGPFAAGPFVPKDDKWALRDSRRTEGIRKFDLHDDGRFKIQATDLDLTGGYFDMGPVGFSLSFGPDDMGTASIQFDRRLHFRAHDYDDDDDDDFDDDDRGRKRPRGRR